MGKPKKKTSSRRTGNRRSHLVRKLARAVNRTSPVRVKLGSPKKTASPKAKKSPAKKPATKKPAAKKPAAKKATPKK
ncbi:MAG: hypothetical protein AAF413_04300 [Patescibacteria group bacterium]